MIVEISYTNHEGKRADRLIRPHGQIMFISTTWHPQKQWILVATDVKRNVVRSFAMKDIHSWREFSSAEEAAKLLPILTYDKEGDT